MNHQEQIDEEMSSSSNGEQQEVIGDPEIHEAIQQIKNKKLEA
jgi:hypothetical protein